jgi:hypothetical protein
MDLFKHAGINVIHQGVAVDWLIVKSLKINAWGLPALGKCQMHFPRH